MIVVSSSVFEKHVLFSSDGTMLPKVLEDVVVNLSPHVFRLIDSLTMTAAAYEEMPKIAEIL